MRARKRRADNRPSSSQRGYSGGWRKLLAEFLRLHPFDRLLPRIPVLIVRRHKISRRIGKVDRGNILQIRQANN